MSNVRSFPQTQRLIVENHAERKSGHECQPQVEKKVVEKLFGYGLLVSLFQLFFFEMLDDRTHGSGEESHADCLDKNY